MRRGGDRAAGRSSISTTDTYQTVDAELLYALLRKLKPRRVIELGSGTRRC